MYQETESTSTLTAMTTQKPIRSDVRRNRERLLAAAHDLFAEVGPDVSREAVAKRAGVGIGTVYRHFPTHDALVEAVYRNEVAQLCDAADELLRNHPPDAALEAWMDRFLGYLATKRGMSDALQSAFGSRTEVFADTRRQMMGALTAVLEAGVEAGTVRSDVDAEDVLGAMSGIWRIHDPERARRALMLILDGLRYRAAD
jgi:AcrR family transcriptional regulator